MCALSSSSHGLPWSMRSSVCSEPSLPSERLLAKPQRSAPNLSLRDSDPTLLPKVGDQCTREDSIGVCISLKRDLQPPGNCHAEAALPKSVSRVKGNLRTYMEPYRIHQPPKSLVL